MNKYTLQQRKKIISIFITEQIKQDKPIETYLIKVAKDGFKHWNFDFLIDNITDKNNTLINIDNI